MSVSGFEPAAVPHVSVCFVRYRGGVTLFLNLCLSRDCQRVLSQRKCTNLTILQSLTNTYKSIIIGFITFGETSYHSWLLFEYLLCPSATACVARAGCSVFFEEFARQGYVDGDDFAHLRDCGGEECFFVFVRLSVGDAEHFADDFDASAILFVVAIVVHGGVAGVDVDLLLILPDNVAGVLAQQLRCHDDYFVVHGGGWEFGG